MKLPKTKIFNRKKFFKGSFSLPMELTAIPDSIYKGLMKAIEREIKKGSLEKDEKIKSITIDTVCFRYATMYEGEINDRK